MPTLQMTAQRLRSRMTMKPSYSTKLYFRTNFLARYSGSDGMIVKCLPDKKYSTVKDNIDVEVLNNAEPAEPSSTLGFPEYFHTALLPGRCQGCKERELLLSAHGALELGCLSQDQNSTNRFNDDDNHADSADDCRVA